MTVDDTLDSRQSDSGSREFGHRMQALEGAEKLLGVGRVKSRPVITDEVGRGAVAMNLGELDTSGGAFRTKFPGIAQQVFENDPQQMRIRRRFQAPFDDKLHFAAGLRPR